MENESGTAVGRLDLAGRRILVVDGDGRARHSLAEQLACRGAEVAEAENVCEALRLVRESRFDAILSESTLPDGTGADLCRALQESGGGPFILLSEAASQADVIDGLNAGASDFVAGPYQVSVLAARLRAHWRQLAKSDDAAFMIGPYSFQPSRRQLVHLKTGKRVVLTDKETALLKYFHRRAGQPVLVPEIMRAIWNYRGDIATHTAQTHVYRLRQKIESDPAHPQIIVSVPGGYCLPAELNTADAAADAIQIAPPSSWKDEVVRRHGLKASPGCCPATAKPTTANRT